MWDLFGYDAQIGIRYGKFTEVGVLGREIRDICEIVVVKDEGYCIRIQSWQAVQWKGRAILKFNLK